MAILDNNRIFGDIFKELRLDKHLSQNKVSEELKVSQALITKWESNQSTPSPKMLDYIADYFEVSTDYLIGRTNDKRMYASDEKNTKIVNLLYDKLKDLSEDKQKIILNVKEAVMKDINERLNGKGD